MRNFHTFRAQQIFEFFFLRNAGHVRKISQLATIYKCESFAFKLGFVYSTTWCESHICMIIGFLGKGGSGKSTLSLVFTQHVAKGGKKILAIDADHNMDLTYNLAPDWQGPYFGSSIGELEQYVGIQEGGHYSDVVFSAEKPRFGLDPIDAYTLKYSKGVSENVRLMSAGPHTDQVLYDKSCSHILFTPLKVYLPYLELTTDQCVVVDEKAGADGAGTGVASGFDLGVIVSEPTIHGVKTAKQIAGLLDFYKTPYLFVGNKIMDESDKKFIWQNLGNDTVCFSFNKEWSRPGKDISNENNNLEKILDRATSLPSTRRKRSEEKFRKNREFDAITT